MNSKHERSALTTVAFIFLILFIIYAVAGCATGAGDQKTEQPFYHYRAELTFKFGPYFYDGMVPVKVTGPIDIQIYSPITLNRVEVSTCSRHEVIRNTAKGWFDKVSNTMTYHYVPTAKELEPDCPVFFQAYNDHVQKAWGMVGNNTDEGLRGHVDCNGQGVDYSGLTMCQTKAGLEQQLTFKVPVEFEATELCSIKSKDSKTFDIRSGVGICKAVFSDGEHSHSLLLLGYDMVIVY